MEKLIFTFFLLAFSSQALASFCPAALYYSNVYCTPIKKFVDGEKVCFDSSCSRFAQLKEGKLSGVSHFSYRNNSSHEIYLGFTPNFHIDEKNYEFGKVKQSFSDLSKICKEDINSVYKIVSKTTLNTSFEKRTTISHSQEDLYSCHVSRNDILPDFSVYIDDGGPYCAKLAISKGCPYPTQVFSPTLFITHSLFAPTKDTILYFFSVLITLLLIILLLKYHFKKVIKFLTLTKYPSLIILIVIGLLCYYKLKLAFDWSFYITLPIHLLLCYIKNSKKGGESKN